MELENKKPARLFRFGTWRRDAASYPAAKASQFFKVSRIIFMEIGPSRFKNLLSESSCLCSPVLKATTGEIRKTNMLQRIFPFPIINQRAFGNTKNDLLPKPICILIEHELVTDSNSTEEELLLLSSYKH
jgi:hypothetical protein